MRKETWIAVGVFVTAVAALLFPSLIGLTVLSPFDQVFGAVPFDAVAPPDFTGPSNSALTDVTYDFTPYALETRAQILAGKLPLWNEFAGAGRPLLAWQQVAPFYPPNALAWVLPYFEALAWIAALKLIVAGLGVFLLGRALGLSPAAGAMAALAYALSTYLVFWMGHPHINSYALLPWLLFAANKVAIRADLVGGLLVGALVGLAWLGGHPPSTAIVLLATGAFFLFRLARESGQEGLGRLGRGGLFAGAIIVGTAVGGVMLLPFVEHLREAFDPARGGGAATLPPRRFLGVFVVPEYFGRRDKVPKQANVFANTAYIGVAPVLLGMASLFVRRSANKIFFALLALVALLLVVETPLAPVAGVIRDLPVLSAIDLSRLMVVIVLCVALLGAFGLDDLVRGNARERLRMLAAMAVIALVPLSLLVLAPADIAGPLKTVAQLPTIDPDVKGALRHWVTVFRWLLIAGAVIGIALLIVYRPKLSPVALTALLLVTAFDVVTMAYGIQPQVERSRVDPPLPPTLQYLRDNGGTERFVGVGGAVQPNLATRYELRDARWASPPHLERYRRLWTGLGGSMVGSGGGSSARFPAGGEQLAALTSSRYLVVPWNRFGKPQLGPVVASSPGSHFVVENAGALPRAWVAHSWVGASGPERAVAVVRGSDAGSLRGRPVVEGAPVAPPGPPAPPAPARIVGDRDPDRVVVDSVARRNGYLILNDQYYPGWRATVDGRPAPILAANGTFRAVRIPPGRHEVTFDYRPASVRVGLALTVVGLLTLAAGGAAVAVAASRRRRAVRAGT